MTSTSATSELRWNLDRLGAFTDPFRHDVTREKIAAYALATGDEHPLHRAGELAPPVYGVVDVLMGAIGPALGTVVPGEIGLRVVHGEQDFHYHRPITPGMALVTRAAAVGVRGTARGVVVLAKAITETTSGDLVLEQHTAGFFRGPQLDVTKGEPLTDHAFDETARLRPADATVAHGFDADQTRRYSAAAADPMPIHLDDAFARSVGLPGIIVHGMCTMAFCGRAVVARYCPEDPTRLRRLAVRLSGIVQPSESITHSLWETAPGRVVFETTSDRGIAVVTHGLAEIAA